MAGESALCLLSAGCQERLPAQWRPLAGPDQAPTEASMHLAGVALHSSQGRNFLHIGPMSVSAIDGLGLTVAQLTPCVYNAAHV